MDRIKILDIFIILFRQYLNNELTQQQILLTIKDITIKKTDLNLIPYKETETIYFILKNCPYYKVEETLEEFLIILETMSNKTPTITPIYILIKAYIKELETIIQNRINSEIILHIYEIAKEYHLKLSLDKKRYEKRLLVNISKLQELTGLYIAQNFEYTQMTLPDLNLKQTSLEEDISKARFNIKDNIDNYFYKTIKASYDGDNFDELSKEILDIIASSDINKNEKNTLLELYTKNLKQIKEKIQRSSNPPKTGQLSLVFN